MNVINVITDYDFYDYWYHYVYSNEKSSYYGYFDQFNDTSIYFSKTLDLSNICYKNYFLFTNKENCILVINQSRYCTEKSYKLWRM